jgi:hypothetical protein
MIGICTICGTSWCWRSRKGGKVTDNVCACGGTLRGRRDGEGKIAWKVGMTINKVIKESRKYLNRPDADKWTSARMCEELKRLVKDNSYGNKATATSP